MIAYKLVRDDLRSYIDGPKPRIFYSPGTRVEAAHSVGLWAVPTLEFALARWRTMHRRDHMLIVELEHEDADIVERTDQIVRLSRCRVVRVVADCEPVNLDEWPVIPGQTLDLAPLVASIPPRPFHARRHGIPHARRCAELAAQMIEAVPDADADVLAAFCLLHDAKRESESDAADGPRAAAFARNLAAAGTLRLDREQLESLCDALAHDYPPMTSDDPSVGLCWDVCRLAVDVVIDSRYLSTAAARA